MILPTKQWSATTGNKLRANDIQAYYDAVLTGRRASSDADKYLLRQKEIDDRSLALSERDYQQRLDAANSAKSGKLGESLMNTVTTGGMLLGEKGRGVVYDKVGEYAGKAWNSVFPKESVLSPATEFTPEFANMSTNALDTGAFPSSQVPSNMSTTPSVAQSETLASNSPLVSSGATVGGATGMNASPIMTSSETIGEGVPGLLGYNTGQAAGTTGAAIDSAGALAAGRAGTEAGTTMMNAITGAETGAAGGAAAGAGSVLSNIGGTVGTGIGNAVGGITGSTTAGATGSSIGSSIGGGMSIAAPYVAAYGLGSAAFDQVENANPSLREGVWPMVIPADNPFGVERHIGNTLAGVGIGSQGTNQRISNFVNPFGQFMSDVGTNTENTLSAGANLLTAGLSGIVEDIFGGGCIIVTACTNRYSPEVNITREYRDKYLTQEQLVGYYWMADAIVPLIENSPSLGKFVKKHLVDHLIAYGKYKLGKTEKKPSIIDTIVSKTFLAKCSLIGTMVGSYTRKNGEIF